MEGRIRQLHLRFDTLSSQEVAGRPVLGGVVEKCRLADSGLATQHEYAATRFGSPVDQAVDQGAFGLPAVQHTVNARRAGQRGHGPAEVAEPYWLPTLGPGCGVLRGLKVAARFGQHLPYGRCERSWVGHEASVVAREYGGLGFEPFSQRLG